MPHIEVHPFEVVALSDLLSHDPDVLTGDNETPGIISEGTRQVLAGLLARALEADPASAHVDPQPCRDCGNPFPYDPDTDICPDCVAEMLNDETPTEA